MADTNVFSFVSSLQRSFDVHVVVFYDSQNDVGGRNAVGSLGRAEHAQAFNIVVDVLLADACVGDVVVGNVVNVMFSDEVDGDDPGAGTDYFVDPFAMPQDVNSFALIHDKLAFLRINFPVRANSND